MTALSQFLALGPLPFARNLALLDYEPCCTEKLSGSRLKQAVCVSYVASNIEDRSHCLFTPSSML